MTPRRIPPPPLRTSAYHGLLGDFVRAIEPHSEADPAALLMTLLVTFGNIVGRSPGFLVNGTQHRANLFSVFVGPTSSGRKGTAHRAVAGQFQDIDDVWSQCCVAQGLSSGEGVIWAVRDPCTIRRGEKGKEKDVVEDGGVEDKRLFVVEEEFGSVLKMCQREGNTLSNVLRLAWDGSNLRTLTKHSAVMATGPHISVVGHISAEDLRKFMTETESANGFGNRFLWVAVERSKCLPDGGFPDDSVLKPLRIRLGEAVCFGAQVGIMTRDDAASKLWRQEYERLSAERPGLFGCIVARAVPQVLRLSMIYALLDKSQTIKYDHLSAALEVWRYCEDSVRYIFGDQSGNGVADRIGLELLKKPEGMTRTDISAMFHRNVAADEIDRALRLLTARGLVRREIQLTNGRAAERFKWDSTQIVDRGDVSSNSSIS